MQIEHCANTKTGRHGSVFLRKPVRKLQAIVLTVIACVALRGATLQATVPNTGPPDNQALAVPNVRENSLRVLTPTLLEVRLINPKAPVPAAVTVWNLINGPGLLQIL